MNIVVPLYDDEDNVYAHVHSTPITRETFEANFLLLSKTFTAIYREGLGELAGPRVASLILNSIAESMSDNPISVTAPILNEIKRLTHVILATPNGWETMLLHDALARNLLDKGDVAEIMNSLVFFTVASSMLPRKRLRDVLPGATLLWGGQTTSQDITQFRDSLPILTGIDSSGATANQIAHRQHISSLPS